MRTRWRAVPTRSCHLSTPGGFRPALTQFEALHAFENRDIELRKSFPKRSDHSGKSLRVRFFTIGGILPKAPRPGPHNTKRVQLTSLLGDSADRVEPVPTSRAYKQRRNVAAAVVTQRFVTSGHTSKHRF